MVTAVSGMSLAIKVMTGATPETAGLMDSETSTTAKNASTRPRTTGIVVVRERVSAVILISS